MFKIKICGITTPDDALLAADAGADAIGINFYEKSPRYLTPESAAEVTRTLRTQRGSNLPRIVGVFVDRSAEELVEIGAAAEIAGYQLHGNAVPGVVVDLT